MRDNVVMRFRRATSGWPGRSPLRRGFAVLIAAAWLAFLGAGASADEGAKRYDGLTLDEWDVRIKAFSYSSPEAARSVPGLIEIVDDSAAPWESRRQAALTLGRMGQPARTAVPHLIRLGSDARQTEETRLWALTALARFGPVGAEAAPMAAQILANPKENHLLQLAATEVLGRIGASHPAAFRALVGMLSRPAQGGPEVSRDSDLRVACTDSLALFGGAARGAVPILLRQMQQPGDRVRQSTLTTLASIGPGAEEAALPVAEILVSDSVPLTRDRAAEALVQIGVGPLLIRLLEIPRSETRERVALALIRARRPVNPLLAAAIRNSVQGDADSAVRAAALKTDWAWTQDADALAPEAVALLGSPDRTARKAGYEVLTRMGDKARIVAPALERLADGSESQAATAARSLLRRLKAGESDAGAGA